MINAERKYRFIAAAVTFLLFMGVSVWLVVARLGFSSADGSQWPPVADTTAVLLADEYIEVEMLPPVPGGGSEPDDGASAPPPEAHDFTDAGQPAEQTAPVVTSPLPSPVTEKPRPVEKPVGPSQAELEARAREKRQKEASEEAANRMKFGKTQSATGSGDGANGSGSGNSNQKGSYTGSGSGTVGGRGVSVAGGIPCASPGKVTVRIYATPAGKVTNAEIVQPTTIADPSVREKCLQRARAAKVTPAPDKTAEERGTITFNFK